MTSEIPVSTLKKGFWKSRNWWKIAFFVLLLVFEVTRELLVIKSAIPVQPNVRTSLLRLPNYTTVSGVWKRTDGGDELVPSLVTIVCRDSERSCVEANTHFDDQYVFPPDLTRLDAEFQPDMITYVNDTALCVEYVTRLDLKLKKVSMMRESKPKPNKLCQGQENRIEATLSDGFTPAQNFTKGRFLPILSGVKLIFS